MKRPKGFYEGASHKEDKISRYSHDDKDGIIKAFNDEKDWKSVTEAILFKEATANNWKRKGEITKPLSGKKCELFGIGLNGSKTTHS